MKQQTPKDTSPQKEKRVRTPRETTNLVLGVIALVLSVLGVAALLWLSALVGAILGGCAVLFGFGALMTGKGGTLPAVIGIVAGFLTVLSAIITMRLQ